MNTEKLIRVAKGEENADGKRYLEYQAWSAKAVSGIATPKKAENTMLGTEEDNVPF
jgi:hypothetical protein